MEIKYFDLKCPYSKFEFWDASVSQLSIHGDYECHTESRGFQPSMPGDEKWRYLCDHSNHKNCYYYKEEKELENEI